MFDNVYLKISMIMIEVSLKITITHLVAILKLSKIFGLFLDGIISEMNKLVIKILQIEFSAGSSNVAIFIKVSFEGFIDRCYQSKYSEIKFPFVYQ